MNKVKYIPYAVFIALLLIALAVCKYQDGIIFDLRKANQGLTVDIAQAEYRMRQAQAEVNNQNSRIAAHERQMKEAEATYNAEIARLKSQAGQTKIQVVKELTADPSCENKLRLIKQIQDGIYDK